MFWKTKVKFKRARSQPVVANTPRVVPSPPPPPLQVLPLLQAEKGDAVGKHCASQDARSSESCGPIRPID
eukprot:8025270-Alexandrium_andersonii.AAC.1